MADIEQAIAEGEEVISVKLAARTEELAALIASKFPAKTLEQIGKEFEASAKLEGEINATVAELSVLTREQAAMAVDDFKKAEMWITLKAPPISDGNNFGVDVQNYVISELKGMRGAMQGMINGASDYHWQRGNGLEKCTKSASVEVSEGKVSETDDGKTTVKESKSSKTSTKAEPLIDDYKKYATAVDTKQYFLSYRQLVDLRDCYIKARVLFLKNHKRLADPRGDEGGGVQVGLGKRHAEQQLAKLAQLAGDQRGLVEQVEELVVHAEGACELEGRAVGQPRVHRVYLLRLA